MRVVTDVPMTMEQLKKFTGGGARFYWCGVEYRYMKEDAGKTINVDDVRIINKKKFGVRKADFRNGRFFSNKYDYVAYSVK